MAERNAAEWARRLVLFAAVAALGAWARPRPLPYAVGLALVASGEALRIWASGHLLKTTVLVTAGPYRWVRHPLYLGRLAIFTGLVLMAWLPHGGTFVVLAAGWAVFFGYYLPRKERIEPARLLARHGRAYADYHRRVPALVPRRRAYPAGSERWSAARFWRNREVWTAVALAGWSAWVGARLV